MSDPATQSEPWTVGRLLAWTKDHFEHHGLDQAQLCAQLLLAHALGCERLDLFLRFDSAPDDDQLAAFRELVRRGASGVPVAYLIGQKEFFSLRFRVTPDVLVPRPETETLVEAALEVARGADRPIESILEPCTGSGCVAVALASQLLDVRITATDASAAALGVAGENVAAHGLSDRIALLGGDLFAGLTDGAAGFDMVVGNPPYVRTADLSGPSEAVARHEPRCALDGGPDGLDVTRRILSEAPARLRAGGWLLLEVGYDQGEAVRGLYEGAGLTEVRGFRDGLGHERVIAGRLAM